MTINRDQKSVAEMQQALYKILGMVGHDISTPITVMDQYFALFRDGLLGPVDPKQQQALEVMRNHSDRLKKIMADVERITSWDAVWQAAERGMARFDIRECAQDVLRDVKPLYDSKKMSLDWNAPDAPLTIEAHRESVRTVLTHLLVNAYKFTPPGTRVELSIQEQPAMLQVTVQDHGRGMQPDTLAHAFDSFYVGTDNSEFVQAVPKHVSSRLGLGLAIAKNIVESHRGKIWAESEWGKFARFHFTLPKHREEQCPNAIS